MDKEKADKIQRQAIEDSLKGEYKPEAVNPWWLSTVAGNEERKEVYDEVFFKTRGSEPPKR